MSNKLLIAVCSCQRDKNAGDHEHARQGWGKELSDIADLRLFVGGSERPDNLLDDEVWLEGVPDDYWSLPLKTKAILKHFLADEQYAHCMKVDCDTTVFPRLFRAFVADHLAGADLASKFWNGCNPYGPAYFLSRRAAEVVIAFDHKNMWQEDYMVGCALKQGITDGTFVQKAFGLPCLFVSYSSHQGKPHGPHPDKLWVWRKRPGQLIGQPFEVPAHRAETMAASGEVEIAEWTRPNPTHAEPPPPRRGSPAQHPVPENQPASNHPLPNVGSVSTGKPDWTPPEPKPEHPQAKGLRANAKGLIPPAGRREGSKVRQK